MDLSKSRLDGAAFESETRHAGNSAEPRANLSDAGPSARRRSTRGPCAPPRASVAAHLGPSAPRRAPRPCAALGGESGIRTVCPRRNTAPRAAGPNRAALRSERSEEPTGGTPCAQCTSTAVRPCADQWRREWDSNPRYPSGHTCWPASTRPSSAATPLRPADLLLSCARARPELRALRAAGGGTHWPTDRAAIRQRSDSQAVAPACFPHEPQRGLVL